MTAEQIAWEKGLLTLLVIIFIFKFIDKSGGMWLLVLILLFVFYILT